MQVGAQKGYSSSGGEEPESHVSDASTYQEEFSWSSVIFPYVFCRCFLYSMALLCRSVVLKRKVKIGQCILVWTSSNQLTIKSFLRQLLGKNKLLFPKIKLLSNMHLTKT